MGNIPYVAKMSNEPLQTPIRIQCVYFAKIIVEKNGYKNMEAWVIAEIGINISFHQVSDAKTRVQIIIMLLLLLSSAARND